MNRVPKLRFKEFSGDWEEKKLEKELKEYYLGSNYKNSENKTSFPLLKMGNLDRGKINLKKIEYIDECEIIFEKDKVKYGDLFFNTRNTPELVGKVAIWRNELPLMYFNSNLMKMTFDNNFFMNYKFNTKNMIEKLKSIATGTTSVGAIYTKDLLKLDLLIPNLQEQQKIADFLSSVDKKISITEEKLDLFKDYKKGIMQKIFKQELRFKDSNGNDYPEWEEKILGKIIIKNKEKNKENKYNLVQSISNKFGFVNQDEYFEDRRVASQDLKNYYVAKNKLFAYNPSRINVGSLAYKEDNNISVISPLYVSFYSNKEYLIDNFLFNWLFSSPFIKQMSCSFEGSVRNNLSFETLSNFIIELPCLEEQEKIANFLSSIDKKIDNLAAELEDLKEFKKGLLQQMFV